MDRTQIVGFPRPGKALRVVLIVIATTGLLNALIFNWIPGGTEVFRWLAVDIDALHRGEWWRLYALFTSGLLTRPQDSGGVWHLAFTLLGLYFLSTDLESRWGAFRFVRFLFISVAVGTGLVLAFDALVPGRDPFFHPQVLFGATAAITATSVAWGRENPNAVIRLFFFLPMTGKWLLWVTIGFCGLYLLYGANVPEGAIAPFGGVITGLLLGGSPSALRRVYLQAKLWVLRRQGGSGGPPQADRPRRAGPPLRVVMGGLEDEKKHEPPKDKRYLN